MAMCLARLSIAAPRGEDQAGRFSHADSYNAGFSGVPIELGLGRSVLVNSIHLAECEVDEYKDFLVCRS